MPCQGRSAALLPLAVLHVSAVPAPVTCHFLPPRNFPYPHTPRLAYPSIMLRRWAYPLHPSPGDRTFQRATDGRVPVWYLAWAALAMQTLRAKGAARKSSPALRLGSQLSDFECSPVWRTEHGAARASCPYTCDVVQHLQLPVPLRPWLHKCCMCSLCLSTILPASSSISTAAIRDEIVLPSV